MAEKGGGNGGSPHPNQTAAATPARFRTLASGKSTDRHGLRTRGSRPPTGAAHAAALPSRRCPRGSDLICPRRAFRMKQVIASIRAAIYARVSSDLQAVAGTIASQVSALVERLRHAYIALDR